MKSNKIILITPNNDKPIEREDVYNPMVKLINNHKDNAVKSKATMLLSQYNTAGGRRIKSELVNFLNEHGY